MFGTGPFNEANDERSRSDHFEYTDLDLSAAMSLSTGTYPAPSGLEPLPLFQQLSESPVPQTNAMTNLFQSDFALPLDHWSSAENNVSSSTTFNNGLSLPTSSMSNMELQALPSLDGNFLADCETSYQAQPGLFDVDNIQSNWDDMFNMDLFAQYPLTSTSFEQCISGESIINLNNLDEHSSSFSNAAELSHTSDDESQTPSGHVTCFADGPSQFSTDDERWQATLNRSRAADLEFLYGVETTKVYCRPSCASRRAGRQHIRFFPFPHAIEAATKAGFRPCKRCMPDTIGNADKGINGVVKALRMIISDAFEPKTNRGRTAALKLEDLAKEADLSPFHFQRVFKASTQLTPGDFSTACQSLALQDALAMRRATKTTHTPPLGETQKVDVAETLQKYSRWSVRTAKKALGGILPCDYAAGMTKANVFYVCLMSPAGRTCIAYSGKGSVHAVLVGEESEAQAHTRFLLPTQSNNHLPKIERCVNLLQREAQDRDTCLPSDTFTILWRARLWLKLVRDGLLGSSCGTSATA